MFADYHVHTSYSDDSSYPMEQVVNDAIRLGIKELCFTDHVDYNIKPDWDSGSQIQIVGGRPIANVNYPLYTEEIARLKEAYKDQITLKLGLEFGIQTHTIPKYEALFSKYPFDFILLSVHQVDDLEFWTQDFQKGRTQSQYNQRYYEELLSVVRRYKHYSVLAHLDLIARYDLAGPYPFERIQPVVTEILKTVIADGKGIEVNTSCRRYGLTDLTPSRQILRLYRDLGGRILTLGSDSHCPQHLGAYIPETKQALAGMGFESFCTYEGMVPQFHPLTE